MTPSSISKGTNHTGSAGLLPPECNLLEATYPLDTEALPFSDGSWAKRWVDKAKK